MMSYFPVRPSRDLARAASPFQRLSDTFWAISSGKSRFPSIFPSIWDLRARLRLGRFDQHIDTAGGDGELAPGLVIDRHAVLDPLGPADALGVAGDQHRLVRVLRRR